MLDTNILLDRLFDRDKKRTSKINDLFEETTEVYVPDVVMVELAFALEKIYDLADRYLTDKFLPSKAIDLMDEAAIMLAKSKRQDRLVRAEDIAVLVSHKTNIPLTQVTTQETSKLLNLEQDTFPLKENNWFI